jgi:RNA polymerase sigma-70 factor (ECF subfamily)
MYERAAMQSGPRGQPTGRRALWPWQVAVNDNDPLGSRTDAQVIVRIRSGDRAAFLEFYDRYAPLLLSVAARVLGDRREAEDVLQDVCTQIWQKSSGYDPALGSLSSWAVTLTRNKAIDRIRASTRRRRLMEEIAIAAEMPDAAPPSANEVLHGRERAQQIRSALTQLSADQRQVIELAFFAGLSQSEIAARLEQPLGTIKARIRRGMLRLRQQLQPGDAL